MQENKRADATDDLSIAIAMDQSFYVFEKAD